MLVGILVLIVFIITPVSAEIIYSQQFYSDTNITANQLRSLGGQQYSTVQSMAQVAMVYEMRRQNELQMKHNELIAEQNDILREILAMLKPARIDINATEELQNVR